MRWPDDPYGKTLDDLDRKRTEVRNLKGKLRTERQKWEEERKLWRGLVEVQDRIDASHAAGFPAPDSLYETRSDYCRRLGLEEGEGGES